VAEEDLDCFSEGDVFCAVGLAERMVLTQRTRLGERLVACTQRQDQERGDWVEKGMDWGEYIQRRWIFHSRAGGGASGRGERRCRT
jgi:hypothetical protein